MASEAILSQLRRQGYKARESGTANELWVCCPFCAERGKSADANYKLGINVKNGKGHCFRCGWASRRALAELKILYKVDYTPAKEENPAVVELPEDFELLDEKSNDEWMNIAWSYVISRGVSRKQISSHQVGLSMLGKYRARVLFPIYVGDRLLGFSGRTLVEGGTPPWLHSPGLKSVYYAASLAQDRVVVVEGIFDALRLERCLADSVSTDVLALLGTNLSEEKLKALLPYKEVMLWLDPDRAGIKAVQKIGVALRDAGKKVSIISSPSDPSDLTQEEIMLRYFERKQWTTNTEYELRVKLW